MLGVLAEFYARGRREALVKPVSSMRRTPGVVVFVGMEDREFAKRGKDEV